MAHTHTLTHTRIHYKYMDIAIDMLCAIWMVYIVIVRDVFNIHTKYTNTSAPTTVSHPSWIDWNIHWSTSIRNPRAFHHDLGSFAPSFSIKSDFLFPSTAFQRRTLFPLIFLSFVFIQQKKREERERTERLIWLFAAVQSIQISYNLK